jgi:heme exporter protein B
MNTFVQIRQLLYKDMVLEWRSKYAINGILLYAVSTIFVCYQAFRSLEPTTWNVLFWIILLFAAINAISKSFVQENPSRQLYYYSIVNAKAVILSKMIYNSLLMVILAGLALIVYMVIFGNPLADPALYVVAVMLGAISFASVFTMVSGISAKAGHNTTLMSVLSFPIIIPLLIILIELSGNAMSGAPRADSYPELAVLIAINIISIAISLLLFPYLWRE